MTVWHHIDKPDENGRHPYFKHLVMFEIERHYDSYILSALGYKGNVLISAEHAMKMFGDQFDDEFAYLTDEYLEMLKEE